MNILVIGLDSSNLVSQWMWQLLICNCDFHIYEQLKEQLKGTRFVSDEDMKEGSCRYFETTTKGVSW